MQEQPLILTLGIDEECQAFFNAQRKLYFPPERNYLDAHLMLFHQLPNELATYDHFTGLRHQQFTLNVTGLINLGAGVAYRVAAPELTSLQAALRRHFHAVLISQDHQGFRPHITVMNKTTPENARALLIGLSAGFQPFAIRATGFDLWTYLDGPWRHERFFPFDPTS